MTSTHCFLRTENRSFCHGVVWLFSHTFKRKDYISIARTEHLERGTSYKEFWCGLKNISAILSGAMKTNTFLSSGRPNLNH